MNHQDTIQAAVPQAVARRHFLTGLAFAVPVAAISASATADGLAAASAPGEVDVRLFQIEQEISKLTIKIDEFNLEINRLHAIWAGEWVRLDREAAAGLNNLSDRQRLDLIKAMPEHAEHGRVVDEQQVYLDAAGALVEEMWGIGAQTSEGRAAKFRVLVSFVMRPGWQVSDRDSDYDIEKARQLMIEMIGGEAAERLRGQFAAV